MSRLWLTSVFLAELGDLASDMRVASTAWSNLLSYKLRRLRVQDLNRRSTPAAGPAEGRSRTLR